MVANQNRKTWTLLSAGRHASLRVAARPRPTTLSAALTAADGELTGSPNDTTPNIIPGPASRLISGRAAETRPPGHHVFVPAGHVLREEEKKSPPSRS